MSPDTEREVLDRLARIEERLKEGERRFDAFDEHVRDCMANKRALRASLLVLSGSILVAAAIVFAA